MKPKIPTGTTALPFDAAELLSPIRQNLTNRAQRRQELNGNKSGQSRPLQAFPGHEWIDLKSVIQLLPEIATRQFNFLLAHGVDAVLKSMSKERNPEVLRMKDEALWNSQQGHYLPKIDSVYETGKRIRIVINICPSTGELMQPGYEQTFEENEPRDLLSVMLHYTGHQRMMITVPLKYLLKDFRPSLAGHHAYSHRISVNMCGHDGKQREDYIYFGVTGRSWVTRLQEHLSGIVHGSKSGKRFYQKFSSSIHHSEGCFIMHFELIEPGYTKQDAMDWEEWAVDHAEPKECNRLNMIAGGYKGLRFLHRLGLLKRWENATAEQVDKALEQYTKLSPRFTSWQNNDVYRRRIFSRERTLDSPEQVNEIRWLFREKKLRRKEIDEFTGIGYERICRILRNQNYPDERING